MTAMSVTDELLQNNEAYAASFDKGGLAMAPAKRVAIVACMDARVDPYAALGLHEEPTIVDGSHVEHAKPAPDLLLLAAERLGLPPERCWAVGDSTWDMRATVAAGETAISVLAGSAVPEAALREAGAARVLPSLTELAALLREVARS